MLSRENNFDLIRLIAAFQVLLTHSFGHLELPSEFDPSRIIVFFPGVLVFFTVSGFLIFSSLDRNSQLKQYFYNRFLRLFPALWLCFLITVILLLVFDIIAVRDLFSLTFIKWVFTQLTFFQFWTPDILRSWGVGTPNGSLWTIPVEIQFYVLLPIIVLMLPKIKPAYKFVTLIIISLIFNVFLGALIRDNGESMIVKLAQVSIFPYLYCFLTGALIYLYWHRIRSFFEGKAAYWLIALLSICILTGFAPSYYPNTIQLILNFILSGFTIALAYTFPRFSIFLKGNDISYGMYIYHMLVINTLISLGLTGQMKHLFYAIGITVILSLISWFFVEKRALRYKHRFNQRSL